MNPELGDDDLPIGPEFPPHGVDSQVRRDEELGSFLNAQIDDCSRMVAELPSVAEHRRCLETVAALREALGSVAVEIRRSHDTGDGHFSTAEVEAVEAALALARGEPA